MSKIRAIVLRAAGINCDFETEFALELAGAEACRIHINRLIENPSLLDDCHLLVFPGGFSYGDDVAAGKILANQIAHHLADPVREFISKGRLVLGICNGFQIIVKAGILPGGSLSSVGSGNPAVTITSNDSGKYEDRWVYLEPDQKKCVFIEPGRRICLPVAHGEGKVVARDQKTLELLKANHVAFRYVDRDGNRGGFPVNPNGAMDDIAGLTDTTGRVLGLMPHPERFVRRTQHPHWTRLDESLEADGMTIFTNAVRFARANL
ncbi:MAG TPA: phosphoribosylformylglycinamidine synthase I [Sedimentisphaerales bacterium]|nr:phosphoribosylformylglycinamidine synthase I [Sedimentisphaerales bacterium]